MGTAQAGPIFQFLVFDDPAVGQLIPTVISTWWTHWTCIQLLHLKYDIVIHYHFQDNYCHFLAEKKEKKKQKHLWRIYTYDDTVPYRQIFFYFGGLRPNCQILRPPIFPIIRYTPVHWNRSQHGSLA